MRIVKGALFTQSLITKEGPTQSALPGTSDLETASVALKERVEETRLGQESALTLLGRGT